MILGRIKSFADLVAEKVLDGEITLEQAYGICPSNMDHDIIDKHIKAAYDEENLVPFEED